MWQNVHPPGQQSRQPEATSTHPGGCDTPTRQILCCDLYVWSCLKQPSCELPGAYVSTYYCLGENSNFSCLQPRILPETRVCAWTSLLSALKRPRLFSDMKPDLCFFWTYYYPRHERGDLVLSGLHTTCILDFVNVGCSHQPVLCGSPEKWEGREEEGFLLIWHSSVPFESCSTIFIYSF